MSVNLAQITPIAQALLDALQKRYPHPKTNLNADSPWQLLVATILSAQCTDARVNQITPELFATYPEPQDLAKAKLTHIEKLIRQAGFYHAKAKNIQGSAKMIVEKFGGEVPKTMAELLTLPGVARKTANCVLYGAYGINVGLAVDTHVKRIAYRLGLTKSKKPLEIEADLMALFPQNEWGALNHRLVWFGREVCKAREGLCHFCELEKLCPKREPIS